MSVNLTLTDHEVRLAASQYAVCHSGVVAYSVRPLRNSSTTQTLTSQVSFTDSSFDCIKQRFGGEYPGISTVL
jgi:hypothetical protein